ncbi:MAG: hypothetical protein FD118_4112, partial [Rhodocyclaceae bacterium]
SGDAYRVTKPNRRQRGLNNMDWGSENEGNNDAK